MMTHVALDCNEKNFSFSLRSKVWNCLDISRLLGEDIKRSLVEQLEISSEVTDGRLVCTITCANGKVFQQMKSELERVLN